MILDAIKTGLTPEARREAMKYMSTGKYTSVHPKRSSKAEDTDPYTYVEFRSAGGNALGEIEKVRTAALQYARSMALAADPEAEKTLYTKKLYKLVSKVRADEPGLKALKDYTDGRIDKETLKFKLFRAHLGHVKLDGHRVEIAQMIDAPAAQTQQKNFCHRNLMVKTRGI